MNAIAMKAFTYLYHVAMHKLIAGQVWSFLTAQAKLLSAQGYHTLTSITFIM